MSYDTHIATEPDDRYDPRDDEHDEDYFERRRAEVFQGLLDQPAGVRWLVEHMRICPTKLEEFQQYWQEFGPVEALKLLASVVQAQESR